MNDIMNYQIPSNLIGIQDDTEIATESFFKSEVKVVNPERLANHYPLIIFYNRMQSKKEFTEIGKLMSTYGFNSALGISLYAILNCLDIADKLKNTGNNAVLVDAAANTLRAAGYETITDTNVEAAMLVVIEEYKTLSAANNVLIMINTNSALVYKSAAIRKCAALISESSTLRAFFGMKTFGGLPALKNIRRLENNIEKLKHTKTRPTGAMYMASTAPNLTTVYPDVPQTTAPDQNIGVVRTAVYPTDSQSLVDIDFTQLKYGDNPLEVYFYIPKITNDTVVIKPSVEVGGKYDAATGALWLLSPVEMILSASHKYIRNITGGISEVFMEAKSDL